MKLKEILSIICFICLAFSCSMENDTIMNDMEKEIVATTDSYTSLQFNLSSGTGLSTKTTTDVSDAEGDSDYSEMKENEKAVNECFVFVAYNDQIIGRRHYSPKNITLVSDGYDNQYTLTGDIMFKVPAGNPELEVYAVGMSADTDGIFNEIFNSATDINKLKSQTIGNLKDFIKVGEGTIKPYNAETNPNGYQTSDKTKDFSSEGGTVQSGKVNITLAHRAAAIELKSFIVKDKNENVINAVITNMQITSQVLDTRLFPGNELIEKSFNPDPITLTKDFIDYRFYSYENSDTEQPITIKIQYTVAGYVPGEYTFTIKTKDETGNLLAKVMANHLYQVYVTITNAVATVQIVTKDWQYNKIEQGMTEITNAD